MARSTMSTLITQLRSLANANALDYTIGDVSYWTDDQLQAALDMHRVEVYEEPLTAIQQTNSAGSAVWTEYRSAYDWYEATSGGTSLFYLQTAAGSFAGTANYTPDYPSGRVTFGTSQGGTTWYLTGRSYDVYAAAADVWRQKAAYFATRVDFSTDNHSLKSSQAAQACERMAQQMERKSKTMSTSTTTLYRSDVEPSRYA